MDIQFLQLNLQQAQNLAKSLPTLELGKLITATVSQNKDGFTLLYKGIEIPVKTNLPLTKGENLQLRVSEIGQNIILKLQNPPQKQQMNPSQIAIQSALKSAIPKQDSYAPLLSNLQQLTQLKPSSLPAEIRQLTESFMQKLPSADQASNPEGLKQAIKNSGIFLEAKLAQGQSKASGGLNLNQDIKANLLKLQASLSSSVSPEGTAKPITTSHSSSSQSGVLSQAQLQAQAQANLVKASNNTLVKNDSTLPILDKLQNQPILDAKGRPIDPQVLQQNRPANFTPLMPNSSATTTQPNSANQAPQSANPQGHSNPQSTTPSSQIPYQSAGKFALQIPTKGQFPAPQPHVNPSIDLRHIEAAKHKIMQQVDAALSRIQLNQIASLPQAEGNINAAYLLDVPVRNQESTDILQMAVEEREARDPESGESSAYWNVNIAIDLEHIGPMQASVQIAGKAIKVNLWTERPESHYLIESEMNDLKSELEKHGFTIETLASYSGLNDTMSFQKLFNLISEKI